MLKRRQKKVLFFGYHFFMLKRRQKKVLFFQTIKLALKISRFSCSSKIHYIVLQGVFFFFLFFLSRRIQVYSHVQEISNMLYASSPSWYVKFIHYFTKKKKPIHYEKLVDQFIFLGGGQRCQVPTTLIGLWCSCVITQGTFGTLNVYYIRNSNLNYQEQKTL